MKIKNILLIFCVFMLGFVSANLFSFDNQYLETPFSTNVVYDNHAPNDFIDENQIRIYEDRIVIYIDDASLSEYADTGSMKPLLDKGANGIRIKPLNEEEIDVGDLISFRDGEKLIIHRVVKKGMDDEGIYFIPKGDNNNIDDGKIRFENIEYITVGVLW